MEKFDVAFLRQPHKWVACIKRLEFSHSEPSHQQFWEANVITQEV